MDPKEVLERLDIYIRDTHYQSDDPEYCKCNNHWPCIDKEMLEEVGELAWMYTDLTK